MVVEVMTGVMTVAEDTARRGPVQGCRGAAGGCRRKLLLRRVGGAHHYRREGRCRYGCCRRWTNAIRGKQPPERLTAAGRLQPRSVRSNVPNVSSSVLVVWLTCIFSASPFDSIRLAVLTVSPNRQYRGIFRPTTPATQGPSYPQPKLFVGPVANGELIDGRQQSQGHARYFAGMQITVPHRQPRHDHRERHSILHCDERKIAQETALCLAVRRQ
uniref:Uncharacterized protein n=1 Tax=Anopheles atroparvus TaxID=41427 RepID=A0A182IL00_ANOAO